MKKVMLGLMMAVVCFVTPALARQDKKDLKAYGTVTKVDMEKRCFEIKGDDGKMYTFMVNPSTDFEIKPDSWFSSEPKLKDVEVGNWVKIEYNMMNPTTLIADEVDIHK